MGFCHSPNSSRFGLGEGCGHRTQGLASLGGICRRVRDRRCSVRNGSERAGGFHGVEVSEEVRKVVEAKHREIYGSLGMDCRVTRHPRTKQKYRKWRR